MRRLKHRRVYFLMPLPSAGGALASAAACIGNRFAAAQLILGKYLKLDHMRVARVPGDGVQAVGLRFKRTAQLDHIEAQVTATVPVRAVAGKKADASKFRFMRKDHSSGETETLAELRQHESSRDHHPAWLLRSIVPDQHQLRSTLLTRIGPAGPPESAVATVRPTTHAGTEADSLLDQKRIFKLNNACVHFFNVPVTVTVQTVYCEADLQAMVRPPVQGHSFIADSSFSCRLGTVMTEITVTPKALVPNQLSTLGSTDPKIAPTLHSLYFAGEGTGGAPFLFLLGQAIHAQSSGSSHSTAAGAATHMDSRSTHADPHLAAVPSPAKYFQPASLSRTTCFTGGGTLEREELNALIVFSGAQSQKVASLMQAPM